jgi:hypothetical protein
MASTTTSATNASSSLASPVNEIISEKPLGLTLRAVLLCIGLAFFFGYIIPIVDMKMRNTFLGATHLPPGAIAVLLVLLLAINPLLKLMEANSKVTGIAALGAVASALGAFLIYRTPASIGSFSFWFFTAISGLLLVTLALFMSRKPLSRNEILTVYISCLFSCLAPGHGAENVFVVNLIGPFYYATRENRWLEFLEPSIRPWMTPALNVDGSGKYTDAAKNVVEGWFIGSPNGQVPWSAWLVPLFVWGTAITIMYIMMACLCVMIRKQWSEREALAFPLLRLPLELTEDVDKPNAPAIGSFFKNGLMWMGFGIAVFIEGLRGLNLYFPDVPIFPLDIVTSTLFTEAPWNQIGGASIVMYPMFVGIAYLLTAEVSCSFWFFYWFIKFQLIGAYMLGFMPATLPNAIGGVGMPYKAFTFYQQIGCYLAYVAIILYTGREHLKHIVLRGFGRRKADSEEANEAMSYPLAFWGFVLSFGILVAWGIAAGMNPLLAFTLWTLYVVIIIALTRIITEAGILFVQQGWLPLGTIGQITNAGGNHFLLSSNSLPPAAMLQGSLMTDLRGLIMPSFIQGFKLAYDRRIALKPLLALMVGCSLITMALGIYMNVRLGYSDGGLTLDAWYAGGASQEPAKSSASLIKGVTNASWGNMGWLGLGILMTYLLMVARSRFAWFPLHPIGLLLAHSYPIDRLWFSVFLGWLCKVLITRFGGSDSYRKTTPLFLGLALGAIVMMLFWLCIDGWQGRIGHKLMPG